MKKDASTATSFTLIEVEASVMTLTECAEVPYDVTSAPASSMRLSKQHNQVLRQFYFACHITNALY